MSHEPLIYRPTPRVLCSVPLGTSFAPGAELPLRARDDLDSCDPPLEYADGCLDWSGADSREARDQGRTARRQREAREYDETVRCAALRVALRRAAYQRGSYWWPTGGGRLVPATAGWRSVGDSYGCTGVVRAVTDGSILWEAAAVHPYGFVGAAYADAVDAAQRLCVDCREHD